MNNLNQKNIILGFTSLTELPYKKITNTVNQFTNIDINANFRQLVDNDLFISKKIESEINFYAGPKSYNNDELETAPDGYKVWSEDIREGNATVYRKINNALSTSIKQIYDKPVNFLKKLGDTVYVGTDTGLCTLYDEFDYIVNFGNDKAANYLYHEYDLSNIYIGADDGLYEQTNSQYFNINSSVPDVKYIKCINLETFVSDGKTLYAANDITAPFEKQNGTVNINPTCIFNVNYSKDNIINDINLNYKNIYIGSKTGLYEADIGDSLADYREFNFTDNSGTKITGIKSNDYLKINDDILIATNKGIFNYLPTTGITLKWCLNENVREISLIDNYVYICSSSGLYEIPKDRINTDNISNYKIYNGNTVSFQIVNSIYKIVATIDNVYMYNTNFYEWKHVFRKNSSETTILKLGKFILNYNSFYVVTDKNIYVYDITSVDRERYNLSCANILNNNNVLQIVECQDKIRYFVKDASNIILKDRSGSALFTLPATHTNTEPCVYIKPSTLFESKHCICTVYRNGTRDILNLWLSDNNSDYSSNISLELNGGAQSGSDLPSIAVNSDYIVFAVPSLNKIYIQTLANNIQINELSIDDFISYTFSGTLQIEKVFKYNDDIVCVIKQNNKNLLYKLNINKNTNSEKNNIYNNLSNIPGFQSLDSDLNLIYADDVYTLIDQNKEKYYDNSINAVCGKYIADYGTYPDKLLLYINNGKKLNAAYLSTIYKDENIRDVYSSSDDAINNGYTEKNYTDNIEITVIDKTEPVEFQNNILEDCIGVEQNDNSDFLIITENGNIYNINNSIYTFEPGEQNEFNGITCDNFYIESKNFDNIDEKNQDLTGKHSYIFLYDNNSSVLSAYSTGATDIYKYDLNSNIVYFNLLHCNFIATENYIYDIYDKKYDVNGKKFNCKRYDIPDIKSMISYNYDDSEYLYALSSTTSRNSLVRYTVTTVDDAYSLTDKTSISSFSTTISSFDFIQGPDDTIYYYLNDKLFKLSGIDNYSAVYTADSNIVTCCDDLDTDSLWILLNNKYIVNYNVGNGEVIRSDFTVTSTTFKFLRYTGQNKLDTSSDLNIYYIDNNKLFNIYIDNNKIIRTEVYSFPTSVLNTNLQVFSKPEDIYMNSFAYLNSNKKLSYIKFKPNISVSSIRNINSTINTYYNSSEINTLFLLTDSKKLYIYNYSNNKLLNIDVSSYINNFTSINSIFYNNMLQMYFAGVNADDNYIVKGYNINITIDNQITFNSDSIDEYNFGLQENTFKLIYNRTNISYNNFLICDNGIFDIKNSVTYNPSVNRWIDFKAKVTLCNNQNVSPDIIVKIDNQIFKYNSTGARNLILTSDNINSFIYDTFESNTNKLLVYYNNNILNSIDYNNIDNIIIDKVYTDQNNINCLCHMLGLYIATAAGVFIKSAQSYDYYNSTQKNTVQSVGTVKKVYNNEYFLYMLEADQSNNNICYSYNNLFDREITTFNQGESTVSQVDDIFFINGVGSFNTSYALRDNILTQFQIEYNSYIKLPILISNPSMVFKYDDHLVIHTDDIIISYSKITKRRFFKLINSAMGAITCVYQLSDKLFMLGTASNGIYYWDNGYIYQDQVIYEGYIGCITKVLVDNIYVYCVSNNNNIYISENTKKWKKYFSLSNNVKIISDICQINTVNWLFSTDNGIYKTNYSYKLINDYPLFTDADAIEMFNEAFPTISSEMIDLLSAHINNYHNNNAVITNINNNIQPIDFSEIFNWTHTNTIADTEDVAISNDIVYNTKIIDNIVSGHFDVYVKNFYTDNEITKVNDASYILKTYTGSDSELYINIPTTLTYYLSHASGVPCNIDPSEKLERLNLKNISETIKFQDSQVSSHYTECSVVFDPNTIKFDQIYNIQANGVSLPLKVYKENNADISSQMYHSLALQTVVNDSELIDNNLLKLYIFGTDEQAVKIYGHRSNTVVTWSYTITFNAGTGEGSMNPLKCFSNKQYVLPPCAFTNKNKFFNYWQDEAGNKYLDQYVITNPIINSNGIINLTAVWRGYDLTDTDTSFVLSADNIDNVNKQIKIINGQFQEGNTQVYVDWDAADYTETDNN